MGKNIKKLSPESCLPPCDEADRFDATNLIRTGLRSGDGLTVRIGQARLRVLERRPTSDDIELLRLDIKDLKT